MQTEDTGDPGAATGPGRPAVRLPNAEGRRRPSGEPPPLPRDPGWSRWAWAMLALIIGDDEAAKGVTAVKWLRREATQVEWAWDDLPRRLAAELNPGGKTGNDDG